MNRKQTIQFTLMLACLALGAAVFEWPVSMAFLAIAGVVALMVPDNIEADDTDEVER